MLGGALGTSGGAAVAAVSVIGPSALDRAELPGDDARRARGAGRRPAGPPSRH